MILSTARQNPCTVYTYAKENGTIKVAKTKRCEKGRVSVRLRGERKRGGGVCECEVSAPELVKKRSDVDTESEKIERMGVGRC